MAISETNTGQVDIYFHLSYMTNIQVGIHAYRAFTKSLYIKHGKVSECTYVHTSIMLGVASSGANDVIMRMTS